MRRILAVLASVALLATFASATVSAAAPRLLFATEALYASSGVTNPEAAVAGPDDVLATFASGGVFLGFGQRACGPVYVYGPPVDAGSLVQIFLLKTIPTFPPEGVLPDGAGVLGTYDAVLGRYPVSLVTVVGDEPTTTPYTGGFQVLAIGGGGYGVDAVAATPCRSGQNGQGQNNNGQGQNG